MPLLPDDSETCVDGLSKGLKEKGIELFKPNETCDVVYCYCGIRLHPLSCPEAFSLNENGKLVGDKRVEKLERNCLSDSNNVNGFPGLGGCSKCLNSLYLVSKKKKLVPLLILIIMFYLFLEFSGLSLNGCCQRTKIKKLIGIVCVFIFCLLYLH
jgi:hypothetical protein